MITDYIAATHIKAILIRRQKVRYNFSSMFLAYFPHRLRIVSICVSTMILVLFLFSSFQKRKKIKYFFLWSCFLSYFKVNATVQIRKQRVSNNRVLNPIQLCFLFFFSLLSCMFSIVSIVSFLYHHSFFFFVSSMLCTCIF